MRVAYDCLTESDIRSGIIMSANGNGNLTTTTMVQNIIGKRLEKRFRNVNCSTSFQTPGTRGSGK